MKNVTDQVIRRQRNGSIDTAYYLQRGRIARSKAAYRSISHIRRGVRNCAALLLARMRLSMMAHRISTS